jgi:hypothetical protein
MKPIIGKAYKSEVHAKKRENEFSHCEVAKTRKRIKTVKILIE